VCTTRSTAKAGPVLVLVLVHGMGGDAEKVFGHFTGSRTVVRPNFSGSELIRERPDRLGHGAGGEDDRRVRVRTEDGGTPASDRRGRDLPAR
jgi:predicted esterase